MSILSIAQHEILKLVGTRRGWISIATLILVWVVVLLYFIQPAARFFSQADTGGLLALVFGDHIERLRDNWASIEVSIYWFFGLYVLPFFAVLFSADQIASDRTRGTLRYLLLRTGRMNLYFSRFLGQLFIMVLLVMVTFLTAVAMTAIEDNTRATAMLNDIVPVTVNVWLVLMPYVALMAVLSVLARSARQAIIYSVLIWIATALLLRFARKQFGDLAILDWIMPGAQVRALLSLDGWEALSLAPVPIAQTFVLLALGAFFMWKRDL